MSSDHLKRLLEVNDRISKRIDAIARMEEDAALVGGAAADGRFWEEKLRLLEWSDKELEKIEMHLKASQ